MPDPPPQQPTDPLAAFQKAHTIGASQVGERYVPTEGPQSVLDLFRQVILGGMGRPLSVIVQDPYGILGWEKGAGAPPTLFGTTEPTSAAPGLLDQLAETFPRFAKALSQAKGLPRPLGTLAKTLETTETPAVYQLKPSVQVRLAKFYELGGRQPNLANWAGVTDELTAAFGGDRDLARTWARLWGATSPNTSVPVNTRESISAWLRALQTESEPMTVRQAQTLRPAKITMAPGKVPNINRALAGEPLSGDKVEAMAGFMVGDPRIPIDVHALYGLGAESGKWQPELPALRSLMTRAEHLPARGVLTDTGIYLRYEQAIRDTLTALDPQSDVNSIFAQTWEGVRAGKGLSPQGGPLDILRRKGLLEPGAMLDPVRLRAALKGTGWTAGSIAALLTGIDQYAPARPVSPSSPDAPMRYAPAGPQQNPPGQ